VADVTAGGVGLVDDAVFADGAGADTGARWSKTRTHDKSGSRRSRLVTPPTRTRRHHAWLADTAGRWREDRGSATGWALFAVLVVALLAGAVLDGGNAMAARVQALDIAQQAARSGANQLDLTALRTNGLVRLDPTASTNAARQFLRQAGVTGTVTATTTQVTVTVNRNQPALLLQAVGVSSITVAATAHAVPATGPQPGGSSCAPSPPPVASRRPRRSQPSDRCRGDPVTSPSASEYSATLPSSTATATP
jgi:Flp pilus assembly protein TadG